MSKLKTIESIVEKILDTDMDSRENDDILYLNVCEFIHRGASSMMLKDFLRVRNEISCPSFASVTRTRRKICEKRPELKPQQITKLREQAMNEYTNYALNN